MTWVNAQSTIRPETLDTTSSRKYNYVRKDITEEVVPQEEGDPITMYNYKELMVPKEDWDIFTSTIANDSRITDIEDVITEIIGGE